MIVSSCSDCNHREICRYKDEHDKIVNSIAVAVPEPFTLTLSCKHYYSTHTYLQSTYDYNYAGSDTNYANSVFADKNIR